MANKRQGINHWFIITFLLLITSLLWFFIDMSKSKNVNFATTTAKAAAKPIKNLFNQQAIDLVQGRFVVPRIDLAKIEPYTSISISKSASINTANNRVSLPAQVQELIASGSGELE
ncbi:hypothetical protein GYA49_00690 [Candidatus Beckwithbacteria bacterium]|nr:hypothetical protein [Candidatus Beckwithbacteria bacterium]